MTDAGLAVMETSPQAMETIPDEPGLSAVSRSSSFASVTLAPSATSARGPLVGDPMELGAVKDMLRNLMNHGSAAEFLVEDAGSGDNSSSLSLPAIFRKLQAGEYATVGQLVDDLEMVWLHNLETGHALSSRTLSTYRQRAIDMRDMTRGIFQDWPRESPICKRPALSAKDAGATLARAVSKGCGGLHSETESDNAVTGALIFSSHDTNKLHQLREEGLLQWGTDSELNALLDEYSLHLAFMVDFHFTHGKPSSIRVFLFCARARSQPLLLPQPLFEASLHLFTYSMLGARRDHDR